MNGYPAATLETRDARRKTTATRNRKRRRPAGEPAGDSQVICQPHVSPEQSKPAESTWLLGMTTEAEQAYFEHYARSIHSGDGEIVDLGCWLGSTTIPLAKGLHLNPSRRARRRSVHAFDTFIWERWMEDCVQGTEIQGRYRAQESFFEEFRRRTAPWSDRIRTHVGNLRNVRWGRNKIEFLLVDAMKSWELANSIVTTFYPHLTPQKSYVLHQDFAHWYTSWIHLIQYRLRPYFRFVHAVPHSPSFVFQCVERVPAELLRTCCLPESFSNEDMENAFDYSLSLAPDETARACIAASKVMLFIHLGDGGRARAELEAYRAKGLPLVPDIQRVEEQLKVAS